MKTVLCLVAAATAVICSSSFAQIVKGNEAVKANSSPRLVETPTAPSSVGKVCAANAGCYAGAWTMVETTSGLMECTEPYARPGSCRASTYGSQKLPRVWLIKRGGEWLQCQYPALSSKCTPLFARPPANLPFEAIQ